MPKSSARISDTIQIRIDAKIVKFGRKNKGGHSYGRERQWNGAGSRAPRTGEGHAAEDDGRGACAGRPAGGKQLCPGAVQEEAGRYSYSDGARLGVGYPLDAGAQLDLDRQRQAVDLRRH